MNFVLKLGFFTKRYQSLHYKSVFKKSVNPKQEGQESSSRATEPMPSIHE